MSKLDPRYWEVAVLPEQLNKFSESDIIWRETEEERKLRYQKEDIKRKIFPLIIDIIENELTEMQRDCIKLHILDNRTRKEVANELGISCRVVTQHIYGIRRSGKRIGGGIKKIKKICEQRGISL
jgi:DNA-directed RNA polymerase specialized sigma subunit